LLPDVFIVFGWLPENRSGVPNTISSKEGIVGRGWTPISTTTRGNVGNKRRQKRKGGYWKREEEIDDRNKVR
jgi:hypothetical protein